MVGPDGPLGGELAAEAPASSHCCVCGAREEDRIAGTDRAGRRRMRVEHDRRPAAVVLDARDPADVWTAMPCGRELARAARGAMPRAVACTR